MGINMDNVHIYERAMFDFEYVQYLKPVLVVCRMYLWITVAGFAAATIAFAVNHHYLSAVIFAPLSGIALFGAGKVHNIENYFEHPVRWACISDKETVSAAINIADLADSHTGDK